MTASKQTTSVEFTKRQQQILLVLALDEALGSKVVCITRAGHSGYLVDSPCAGELELSTFSWNTLESVLPYIDGKRIFDEKGKLVGLKRAHVHARFELAERTVSNGKQPADS